MHANWMRGASRVLWSREGASALLSGASAWTLGGARAYDNNPVLDLSYTGDTAHHLLDARNGPQRRPRKCDLALLNADVDRRGERVS